MSKPDHFVDTTYNNCGNCDHFKVILCTKHNYTPDNEYNSVCKDFTSEKSEEAILNDH